MKFYAGTLTEPIKLQQFQDPGALLEFPAGQAVSVAMFDDEPELNRYHLNTEGPGGMWDTYTGYAPREAVQVGEVIATCNEG